MTRPLPTLMALIGAGLAALPVAAGAGELWLTLDEMRQHRFGRPVGKIVVANPAVADVQVLSATEMMMFGRAHGVTSVTFFDRDGQRMDQMTVRVGNDSANTVTLQAGGERYTYSCTKRCQQAVTLGDGGAKGIQALVADAVARQQMASGEARLGSQTVSVAPAPRASRPAVPAPSGSSGS